MKSTHFTFSIPSSKASTLFVELDVTAADADVTREERNLPVDLKLQSELFVVILNGGFKPRELDLTSLLSIGTKSREPLKIIPESDGAAITFALMVRHGVVMAALSRVSGVEEEKETREVRRRDVSEDWDLLRRDKS